MKCWKTLYRRFPRIRRMGLALLFTGAFFLSMACLTYFPASTAFTAYGSDNEIRDIAIAVELEEDGSAQITEVWDVYVGSGTEWYLVQGNSGKITIEDFSVSDETGLVYENEGRWDVNRSLKEKAGKCGIVDKKAGNYELCFGVGSYGDHEFTVSYRMTNFVKGFDDYCGFNQRFVNDELSSRPQHISVTIEKPGTGFTPDEVKVWAFGFDGTIFVKDGAVVAESGGRLSSSDYVNIMCRFPREIFDAENVVSGSFSSMQDQAFKGSEYKSGKSSSGGFVVLLMKLWLALMAVLAAAAVVFAVIGHIRAKADTPLTFEDSARLYGRWRDKKTFMNPLRLCGFAMLFVFNPLIGVILFLLSMMRKNRYTEEQAVMTGTAYTVAEVKSYAGTNDTYYRDIPLEGNICAIHAVLKMTGWNSSESDMIGAYLLKWLQGGFIEMRNTKKTGLGGVMGQDAPSIVLKMNPTSGDWVENNLFTLLVKASGGDNILQEKELYRWAKSNYSEMQEWIDQASGSGRAHMRKRGYLHYIYVPSFFNMSLKKQDAFTETGRQQVFNLGGFKNYLKDFTLMQEREPLDVALWDDYLVVSQLFGMADRVAETFRKLYPSHFDGGEYSYGSDPFDMAVTFSIVHAISHAGVSGAQRGASAASSDSASSGGGGFSSSGGGGGFSGGGSGGGSR